MESGIPLVSVIWGARMGKFWTPGKTDGILSSTSRESDLPIVIDAGGTSQSAEPAKCK